MRNEWKNECENVNVEKCKSLEDIAMLSGVWFFWLACGHSCWKFGTRSTPVYTIVNILLEYTIV